MATLSTKISDMTVGELLAIIDEHIGGGQKLHGLAELSEYLGCSLRTAQGLKSSGRLDGAYVQAGRKIVFDRDKVDRKLR